MDNVQDSNKKKHIYLIIRCDIYRLSQNKQPTADEVEGSITGKQVYTTREEAEANVIRLNKLENGRGSHYFYVIGRSDVE